MKGEEIIPLSRSFFKNILFTFQERKEFALQKCCNKHGWVSRVGGRREKQNGAIKKRESTPRECYLTLTLLHFVPV